MKRNQKVLLAALAAAGAISLPGCSGDSTTGPGSNLVVIRAYLYAGQPVTDITITGTLALGSQDTLAPPINDAQVYLLKDGTRYDLVPSEGDSGYYHYEGSDLTVNEGDEFEIGVVYFGRTATGSTVVPPAPENVVASSDTLIVSTSRFPGEEQTGTTLEMSWDQVESALWYVMVENIDADPEPIIRGGFFGGGGRRFIFPPTTSNEYTVRTITLTYYGNHRVSVYRINQEYADLYGSRQQDSRDLNEPLTNIRNGLGVFSAFNSQEVHFYAREQ